MWTIFKVFIELITTLLPISVLVFWLQGMWDLSSLTRDQTCASCLARLSLNCCTSREVPLTVFCFCFLIFNLCTCVPNPEPLYHLHPHPIPLGHPSAPAPSILYPASNLDWRFISYMILYMFKCHSPKSSHPLPLPQSPKDCSIHLCLFCCLMYRVIVTIFLNSIYMR